MKTIWLYFLHDDKLQTDFPAVMQGNISVVANTLVALYAFTPSREVRAQFTSERDMSKFTEKAIDLSDDNYEDFFDEYEDLVLEYHGFRTSGTDDLGYIIEKMITVLCTRSECDSIIYYGEEKLIDKFDYIYDKSIFNFINMLKPKLRYLIMKELALEDFLSVVGPLEESWNHSFQIDEFALYLNLFGNTYEKRNLL